MNNRRLFPKPILSTLALVLLASVAPLSLPAQPVQIPYHKEPYLLDSGVHDGLKAAESTVAFRQVIQAPGAPWLRLHISDYHLGTQSYITITSLQDGGRQRLDTKSLPQWGNSTAYFNGDAVEVELHVAPGEQGIFIRIEEITVGERGGGGLTSVDVLPDLCGGDDRVTSNNPRVGRLVGPGVCTAWLTSNGALLTAGHCADSDPDRSGPMLPDGVLDWTPGTVVGFNVPPSQADGNPVAPDPDDQYPIDLTRVDWEFDGTGQGLGKDWAVFAALPNSTTGLLPHQAQGAFFRMTAIPPKKDDLIRVTGYGLDNTPPGPGGPGAHCCDIDSDGNCNSDCNAQSLTQQTATGKYVKQVGSGPDVWHVYAVDTTPATSGSPVIRESPKGGFAIGINTNSGCSAYGGNFGTSFGHQPLEDALEIFPGPNTIYVDKISLGTLRTGGIFTPFSTVSEAVTEVPSGGIISIVAGSYSEKLTIKKAVTLSAPVGTVTIGKK